MREVGADVLFEDLVLEVEPALRRALVVALGPERGDEAVAEAWVWAWNHRAQVLQAPHPVPYLYRVGVSRTRMRRKRLPLFPDLADSHAPTVEPGLPRALERLTRRQRVAVVLVHAYGYSLAEVGEILSISRSSVQNHLSRGMQKLRGDLVKDGHDDDA